MGIHLRMIQIVLFVFRPMNLKSIVGFFVVHHGHLEKMPMETFTPVMAVIEFMQLVSVGKPICNIMWITAWKLTSQPIMGMPAVIEFLNINSVIVLPTEIIIVMLIWSCSVMLKFI